MAKHAAITQKLASPSFSETFVALGKEAVTRIKGLISQCLSKRRGLLLISREELDAIEQNMRTRKRFDFKFTIGLMIKLIA